MDNDLRLFEEKKKNTLISEAIYKNIVLLFNLKQEKSSISKELKTRETVVENKDKLIGK